MRIQSLLSYRNRHKFIVNDISNNGSGDNNYQLIVMLADIYNECRI